MTGQLIIVTGRTGAGKTTTCEEFVDTAEDLWLHFGADLFLSRIVPKAFIDGGDRCTEGVHMEPDDPSNPTGPAHLDLGTYGQGMIRTMHAMAATAVRSGQKVVMDHVTTMHPPLLQDCVAQLHGLPVLFVALQPRDDLLDARLDARLAGIIEMLGVEHGTAANEATRRVGAYMAREIFSHDCFDLVIDNGELTPRQVVEAIRARLADGPGEAFKELASKFGMAKDPAAGSAG